MQLGERRVDDARGVVDVLGAEHLAKHGLDPQPDGGVVAVFPQVDEGRDEAAELVAAEEGAGATALVQA